MTCDRPRDERKRESIKCRIPPAPPKFADCFGMQRRIHNRFHIDSRFAPSGREKLKQSEMQNEDHADHSDPAGRALADKRGGRHRTTEPPLTRSSRSPATRV